MTKVLKFGGTSVGTAERIQNLNAIVQPSDVVVLSAMSGTTNCLVKIGELSLEKKEAKVEIDELKKKYISEIKSLFVDAKLKQHFLEWLDTEFEDLQNTVISDDPNRTNLILAKGESWSTQLFVAQGQEKGLNYSLYHSPDFIQTLPGEDETVDFDFVTDQFKSFLASRNADEVSVFQGFICATAEGDIHNLGRGGSDYTAAIIGGAIDAEEVQIWTDVDGFCANDPRVVENPRVLSELSFEEAAELAYFGAKILHPATILPCREKGIPVRLKNTLKPNAPGTLIHANATPSGIRAVAAKDGITGIKISSSRMLLAHGFLQKIFEVFSRNRTSIDMIATSEVSVSLSIDNDKYLPQILTELEALGRIEVFGSQSIVSVVGSFGAETVGIAAEITKALSGIPLGMISYGGSKTNISFLIPETEKVKALVALNELVPNKEVHNELV